MNHWLAQAAEILKSPSGDLRELAEIAGYDPKEFYKHQDLSQCDLRGQDLRGLDFTGCNIEFSKIDGRTLIDPQFDPRKSSKKVRYLELDQKLVDLIDRFDWRKTFASRGWFIRFLSDVALHALTEDRANWKRTVHQSDDLRALFTSKAAREKSSRMDLLINDLAYERAYVDSIELGGRSPAVTYLICIGICKLIGYDPKHDKATVQLAILIRKFRSTYKFRVQHPKKKEIKIRDFHTFGVLEL